MNKNRYAFLLTVAILTMMIATTAFAADAEMPDMIAAFTTGMSQLQNTFYGLIAVIVPICITMTGAYLIITKGLGWFKKLGAKSA